ncbi:MAG: triose-phosphate isomerase [Planctomycetota bacterium]|nr:triose-phosphate isomerase [Planctomycetota bacterium]
MRPLIAGNWKMNLLRRQGADLAAAVARGLRGTDAGVDVTLFPPFPAVAAVVEAVADSEITVGGQDLHAEDAGAHTGAISGPMLLDMGATRVLVGHSERRQEFGESDEVVNLKLKAALRHDILPVLCVGDTHDEREAGQTEAVVERQVRTGLEGVVTGRAAEITVAYEPVWAIGTGVTATPDEAAAVHARIHALLQELWGQAAESVRVLYGGSVTPGNAADLLTRPGIEGALVGGASLDARDFCAIVRAACA